MNVSLAISLREDFSAKVVSDILASVMLNKTVSDPLVGSPVWLAAKGWNHTASQRVFTISQSTLKRSTFEAFSDLDDDRGRSSSRFRIVTVTGP